MNKKIEKPPINWINSLGLILVPVLAVLIVPYYWITVGFNTFEWICGIVFILLCGLAITGGYHRLWAHKTYKGNAIYRFFWAYWGACAAQNTIIEWASDHRVHHKYVDVIGRDPYCIKQGFFFAHMGWILRDYNKNDFSNVEDLKKEKIVMWQHNNYLKILFFSNIIVPLILGSINYIIIGGNFWGVFVFAGIFRFVFNHHATFLINSACHYFGNRPYSTKNSSRDNFLLALFTFGEGYHNYHHSFQSDYRNGVKLWHFDPTKWMIFLCSFLGMTTNLKRTANKQILKQKELNKIEKYRDSFYKKFNILPSNEIYEQLEKSFSDCKQALNEWIISSQKLFNEARINKISQQKKLLAESKISELKQIFRCKKDEYQNLLNHFSIKLKAVV